ncbi:hypothetical protein CAPTEDRAFT_203405 [Capitella teleta]|uniref:Uncharacterized protein n=1 Tax=Capitella teleta TaxID=283909 RepID=R7VIB3_CAPTE|nr:hypothetical protein CAPTEDRAFT_203405 [Capitella teleta]|eukprot:ELU15455.1 hypothetical protein CAPTEDRAFT_203405 [Capitella teleta]
MASPSTKQGPMKAILPFGLRQDPSPTFPAKSQNGRKTSPTSSPSRSKILKSPDFIKTGSPDRSTSPGVKGEKFRPNRQSPGPHFKRPNPLDILAVPYLKGEWPRCQCDLSPTHHDKTTQTPDEWEDCVERKKKHKRTSSNGTSDGFVKKGVTVATPTVEPSFRFHLQQIKACLNSSKAKEISWVSTPSTNPTLCPSSTSSASSSSSKAVSIPLLLPRPTSRVRGSVEGFSQEIEKLGLANHSDDSSCSCMPDGRAAPVSEILQGTMRSVDTQTPSNHDLRLALDDDQDSHSSSSSSSPTPCSPSHLPIMPGGLMERSRPSSQDDNLGDDLLKDAKDINSCHMFVREPPDGCEKVKMVEETRGHSEAQQLFCPIKKYATIPSAESAFCPLVKTYLIQPAQMAKSYVSED